MRNLLDKMLQYGMGDVMEMTRAEMLKNDKVYQKDLRDLLELEERYNKLEIEKDKKILINDYIACMETTHCRAYDVAYLSGVKDAITFLSYLGFFKVKIEE